METITYTKPLEPWKFVNKQIERSNIRRFNWKSIFYMSLTRKISLLRQEGLSANQAYNVLSMHNTLIELNKKNPNFADYLRRKIKISVAARYGEQNSLDSIK